MEKEKRSKICGQLFLSTLKISAFTIGGGYVIVPMMKKRFVDDLKWLDDDEMLDVIALAQASPGPIAISASVLIGYRMAGIIGALVTVLATTLPPLVIMAVVTLFYDAFAKDRTVAAILRAMQVGSAATIIGVVVSMTWNILKKKEALPIIVMAAAFAASAFFGVNAAIVILVCCALGVIYSLIITRTKRGDAK